MVFYIKITLKLVIIIIEINLKILIDISYSDNYEKISFITPWRKRMEQAK